MDTRLPHACRCPGGGRCRWLSTAHPECLEPNPSSLQEDTMRLWPLAHLSAPHWLYFLLFHKTRDGAEGPQGFRAVQTAPKHTSRRGLGNRYCISSVNEHSPNDWFFTCRRNRQSLFILRASLKVRYFHLCLTKDWRSWLRPVTPMLRG